MRPLLFLFFTLVFASNVYAQSADIMEGCSPLQVAFKVPATTSNKYFWDFKDGVTSDLQNPVNIFTKAGTYQVTIQESFSGPIISTITIKVYPAPSLNFTVDKGCAPFNATFVNTSAFDPNIKVAGYDWVFGDGQNVPSVDNPKHTYSSPGKYSVFLNIKSQFPSCNTKATFENAVEIIAPPVASFSTNPSGTTTCQDSIILKFTNTSVTSLPASYKWVFGNGKTSLAQNPDTSTHQYTKGKYTASLQVSYATIPGCVATTSRNISAGRPNPPIIKNIFKNQTLLADSICPHDSISITTDVIGFYSWNFGPKAFPTSSSQQENIVEFKTFGNHIISLKYTTPDGQCTNTITDTVYVDSVSADILAVPRFNCNNPGAFDFTALSNQTNVTYSWNFINGSDVGKNVKHSFSTNTDKLYYGRNINEVKLTHLLIRTIKTGCIANDTIHNSLWLPNALIMPDIASGCSPLSVVFSDSSTAYDKITSWHYNFGDGQSLDKSDNKPVSHIYQKPGEYLATLVIKAQSGCTDTSYATLIRVGNDLVSELDITADKTDVCPGEFVQLNAKINPATTALIEGYHFSTEQNESFHCSSENALSWAYNDVAGPQDVSLTVDYRGCLSTATKKGFINVKGAIAKIDYISKCSDPLNYEFTDKSINATSLIWNFGDGKTGTTSSEIHSYTPGDYTITLTAGNSAGCAPTVDTRVIHVRNLKSIIKTDSLLCINTNYSFSAQGSADVFANCHTGYTWRFPDTKLRPHTSQNSVSSFRFSEPGNHRVYLETTDINGCKDTAVAHFKIFEIAPKISVDKNLVCNPTTVQFSDLSSGDTTLAKWSWKFGDDSLSILQNPAHTYTKAPKKASVYAVQLIMKDVLGCSDTAEIEVKQYLPVSKISINKNGNLCFGDSALFTASDYTATGSNLTFSWEFGNGLPSGSQQKISRLYKPAGNYLVRLKYTEIASGCIGSDSVKVQVQNYPSADFTTDVDTVKILCAPQTVKYSNKSIGDSPLTYLWNFGNGQSTTGKDPVSFYNKGDYIARLIASTSFGCTDTAFKAFHLIRPEGSFTKDKSTICKGDTIVFKLVNPVGVGTYTWAFGDGTNVNDKSPATHRFNFHPPSNATQARLILKGTDGYCPVVVEQQVNILDVIADFDRLVDDSDSIICFSEGPYRFINKSTRYDGLIWNFGDGISSVETNPVHQYAGAGIYNVSLSLVNNTLGCKDTLVKQAIVYNNPVVRAIGDTICQGKDTLKLQVINPVKSSNYLWTPATGLSSASSVSPAATIEHTINYQVQETDTNGCTGTTQVPAIVVEPLNSHNWDTTIIIGDQIALPLDGDINVYNFKWSPPEGLSCLNCTYPLIRPLEDIVYTLDVSDILGCFTNTFAYSIQIKKETFIRLPTTFTPNDDGNNDRIFVQGWGIRDLLEFMIFNRWGEIVYTSSDINEGWDGKFKGQLQNSDAYVYKVKVKTWREEELYQEGYINLLH